MGSDNDNFFHKRKAQREKDREKKARQRFERRILVITEGETEQIYFQDMCNILGHVNVEVQACCRGTSFRNLISEATTLTKTAKKEGVGYTHVFCIFDLDVETDSAIQIAREIHGKKVNSAIIYAITSYPCVEFWFLLHFKYSCSPFLSKGGRTTGDVAKSTLRQLWPEYHVTLPLTYQILERLQVEKQQIAYTNAKRVFEHQTNCGSFNPITNVHELFIFLKTLKEKEVVENFSCV